MSSSLPFFICGQVVRGFGRGSRSLGTPTANFDDSTVKELPSSVPIGIYFGWAQVNRSPVYPMVTSLGWNPYFANEKRSMETHIMHEFINDFYGSELKICLAGYLREEKNYNSLDQLKEAIQNDIENAKKKLALPEFQSLSQDSFFSSNIESPDPKIDRIPANEVHMSTPSSNSK